MLKTAASFIGYTSLNFRYASLILPVGVVAYLLGVPGYLAVTAFVLLILATVAELATSIINGLTAVQQIKLQDQYIDSMFKDVEQYANGGWVGLDGSEGEDSDEDGEEGQPAR